MAIETGNVHCDAFSALINGFSARTSEVKNLFMSRVESHVQDLYTSETQALEHHVAVLEEKMRSMHEMLKKEKAEIAKARALQRACFIQRQFLDYIERHLPNHLPKLHPEQASPQAEPRRSQTQWEAFPEPVHVQSGKSVVNDNFDRSVMKPKPRKKGSKCRAHITQIELDGLSAYMRGRLTPERVNAAIDEIVELAEANAKLIAAAKARATSITAEERNHAVSVLNKISKYDGVDGRLFFLESDLKGGTSATLDNTGRSILTVLRHLGKLNELRITVSNATRIIYVLQ